MAFHQIVAWSGGNRWVHKILSDMHVLSRFFGIRRHIHTLDTMEDICQRHTAVYEALKERDASPSKTRFLKP